MTMGSRIETRPERAFYNVGVALRLIEGVLDDLERDLRVPAARPAGRMVDHIVHALHLIEQLDPPADPTTAPAAARVRTQLRGELETLLVDLTRQGAEATV
ncbi:MAG: hypothetical protein R3E98_15335 [Gemmatimonadota bacterium]|nr:hypothetical protein [Gemmatimonadota bacterium]